MLVLVVSDHMVALMITSESQHCLVKEVALPNPNLRRAHVVAE